MNEPANEELRDILKLLKLQMATHDALYELIKLRLDTKQAEKHETPKMTVTH